MTEQQHVGGDAASEALAWGRHRQHVFPGRGNVVKVRYADEERSTVGRAGELTGLRTSGFVAAAALLLARGLVAEGSGAPPVGEAEQAPAVPSMLGGRPAGRGRVVAWGGPGGVREGLNRL